ncbi:hypothetical protein PUN28_010544 [Cardiocondyla obscurior]|uniref:Uncharacterized protein n=1 Tax=Cardiocondyla obscurior TaxID=286306 RepID=A0AAW2FGE8_9HYME
MTVDLLFNIKFVILSFYRNLKLIFTVIYFLCYSIDRVHNFWTSISGFTDLKHWPSLWNFFAIKNFKIVPELQRIYFVINLVLKIFVTKQRLGIFYREFAAVNLQLCIISTVAFNFADVAERGSESSACFRRVEERGRKYSPGFAQKQR